MERPRSADRGLFEFFSDKKTTNSEQMITKQHVYSTAASHRPMVGNKATFIASINATVEIDLH
ncbi:MAG: hypothetical protein DRR11_05110 [Gammaproteobacteria bacterium]|nr:MAG: hypothetical protein DRR11_05110 [Gammaproteobacteria bacterium]RLA35158.1 MAG: hypothetical protein DRR15_08015 [Gammaproteobacteria bacterium]